MKKIFTLMLVAMTAVSMKAQMHGAMKFAGKSSLQVSTMNIENPNDVVIFTMADATSGDITLSKMQAQGMPEIPSFTIKGVSFSMGANHVITFPEQTFSTAVTVDGVEKTVTGTSLSGTYDMADQSLTLNAVFKYGAMPFPMTYSVKAYYVKPVTNAVDNVKVSDKVKNDGVAYDLSGRRVGDNYKGIVIVNGKKYLRR